jgi:uncharacterized protein
MAEYLAPGVYVEETSFRAKSIEGVGTSTSAFVGLTLKGPTGVTPDLLTSFADFERVYGGLGDLVMGSTPMTNYMAYAVQAYFANGGSRLYVSRVSPSGATNSESADIATDPGSGIVKFNARFPGEMGNGQVRLVEKSTLVSSKTFHAAPLGSILRVKGGTTKYFLKQSDNKRLDDWQDTAPTGLVDADLATPPGGSSPTLDLITLMVVLRDQDGNEVVYDDLGYSPNHPRWIGTILAAQPSRRMEAMTNPLSITITDLSPLQLRESLATAIQAATQPFAVTGGTNGGLPTLNDYQTALGRLEFLDDIAILAAPGYSAHPTILYQGVEQALITHVERRRAYQIAVLDTPPGTTPTGARVARSQIDSTKAALYYPWVVVTNPLLRTPTEITLPPSGFVCGIYARNDIERGVYKAPANEIVRGALRFETDINFAQQEVLNPLGINCLRFFPGRGYRVWGARTVSSDPEWKYVNVRRYFNYLEASIDHSTQWVVFEPNGERLWSNIRETISAFLFNEWRSGALLGSQPEQAFFVRCDRSTMTQNDLDNGRLICLIGVAALKPAEFVIFRIGQKTADTRE